MFVFVVAAVAAIALTAALSSRSLAAAQQAQGAQPSAFVTLVPGMMNTASLVRSGTVALQVPGPGGGVIGIMSSTPSLVAAEPNTPAANGAVQIEFSSPSPGYSLKMPGSSAQGLLTVAWLDATGAQQVSMLPVVVT